MFIKRSIAAAAVIGLSVGLAPAAQAAPDRATETVVKVVTAKPVVGGSIGARAIDWD